MHFDTAAIANRGIA